MVPEVAVVGSGQWGKNLVRTFRALGALRTVCDVVTGRLDALRERFPDVALTASFDEVLADAQVSAVALATPAASHYRLARQALLMGKDVFVEKPLALRTPEGRELVELAERENRILMVGHLLRYHPAISRLKSLIDDGALGKLCYVYSNRLNLGRFRTEENILWSFAPHDVSVMLYLLGESPVAVTAKGGTYLTAGVPDVTLTTLEFRSGVRSHIFLSWLNPYKEQKLIVVGDKGMAVFDDVVPERKLVLFDSGVIWRERMPVPNPTTAVDVAFSEEEPLRAECRHFLDCIERRQRPATDGHEGLRVLEVLEACQTSLETEGVRVSLSRPPAPRYFAHATAVIDEPSEIGEGTRIWHFSHVMANARIGRRCNIGQNVVIAPHVVIGENVKIQNNVSVYEGVTLEDHVFCGPSMVFTNVNNLRSEIRRMDELRRTLVRQGASLGANCTIVCGTTIGQYAFIGAGAVVVRDVPDFGLVVGNPARLIGWMCRCGERIPFDTGDEASACLACGSRYQKVGEKVTLS